MNDRLSNPGINSEDPRIAVLMCSFNRKDKTLKALTSLYAQTQKHPRQLSVFLVDDESSDGTRYAVMSQFPQTRVIRGTGQLYWNGGMRRAFQEAIEIGFNAYLWLNDDVVLYPGALDEMLNTSAELRRDRRIAIIVGPTKDPITGVHTYGGIIRKRHWTHYSHQFVQPSGSQLICCESMNGNVTLIPAEVTDVVGNLERRFQHHFGDIDYGYRARNAGFEIITTRNYVADCSANSVSGTWRDKSAPIKSRWKDLLSVKGHRLNEWLLFTLRHYGYLWPAYFLWPYLVATAPELLTFFKPFVDKRRA